MRCDSMKRRLEHLEGRNRTTDGVLHFADGSSRVVKISRQNRLRIFHDAMTLTWFYLPPERGDPPGPTVKPYIKHEAAVRLIGGAERVETDDKFLRLTWEMAAAALQTEREAGGENAPAPHQEK
jgi:hypothetical protein